MQLPAIILILLLLGPGNFMYNLPNQIASDPIRFRQLKCGDYLATIINCQLDKKFEDVWSHQNYIMYVMEGRKIWHTAHGSYDLNKGSCVFVRKGACIVEQFFDVTFCFVIFFIPDGFISEVLKTKTSPVYQPGKKYEPVILVESDAHVHAFFQAMMPHFYTGNDPDPVLLELKFRELVLTLASNHRNGELLAFFGSLVKEPQAVSLKQVMEDNYCFNLKLEAFARLSNRSLSAFKRDFQKQFQTSPGKWLLEKRLHHAMNLLTHAGKTVSEASFESGFENPSHFSRAFRQFFGRSPGAVKQQIPA